MRAPPLTFKRARVLRQARNLPEVVLWQALRGKRLGKLRFRRQHPIGSYILDFYCPSAKLAVEIDGSGHHFIERGAYDTRRDQWLEWQGIRVLRFQAKEILKDASLHDVLRTILAAAEASPMPPPSPPAAATPPPLRGGGT